MSARGKVRVAAISLATMDGELESNYARAFALAQAACREQKPQILLFPEAFAAGYCGTDMSRYAEEVPGPSTEKFINLARRTKTLICFGLLERAEKGVYNTAVLVDGRGILGLHRKSHLFIDNVRPYRNEQSLLLPGQTLEPINTPLGKLGILICYESCFPETWRVLVLKGADMILCPYNCEGDPSFLGEKFSAMNLIPMVGADRTGTVYRGPGKWGPNLGAAFVYSATGKCLGRTAPGVEAILHCEIDIEEGKKLRKSGPGQNGTYQARRPDLYHVLTAK